MHALKAKIYPPQHHMAVPSVWHRLDFFEKGSSAAFIARRRAPLLCNSFCSFWPDGCIDKRTYWYTVHKMVMDFGMHLFVFLLCRCCVMLPTLCLTYVGLDLSRLQKKSGCTVSILGPPIPFLLPHFHVFLTWPFQHQIRPLGLNGSLVSKPF